MPRRRHLLDALRLRSFRRLLSVRLASQFGDGVFQASLAGAVLFNPAAGHSLSTTCSSTWRWSAQRC